MGRADQAYIDSVWMNVTELSSVVDTCAQLARYNPRMGCGKSHLWRTNFSSVALGIWVHISKPNSGSEWSTTELGATGTHRGDKDKDSARKLYIVPTVRLNCLHIIMEGLTEANLS